MTLHDQLSARVSLFAWPAFAMGLICIVLLCLGLPGGQLGILVAAILLFVQAALVMAACFFVRCPNCSSSLGALVGYLGPFRRKSRQVQCCPFCAVSFNDQAQV